jgi:hypothetical protein
VQALLEKLIVTQLVWKFPAFMEYKVYYCVRRVLPLDLILTTYSPVYALSHISLRFILILSSYLHPYHLGDLVCWDSFYQHFTCSSFPILATSSNYLILLDSFFITDGKPVAPTGCEHCHPGYQCNPISGACIKGRMSISSSTVIFLVAKVGNNSTKTDKWCVAVLFRSTGSSHAY